MKKKTTKAPESTSAGREIIASLTDLRDTLASGTPLHKKYVVREVQIPEPRQYSPRAVKTTRARLGVSQQVFAKLVGVSAILAQSWEQGKRLPSPLARRLLDEINRDPKHWSSLLSA